ncbi:hypothetical protein Syun_018816 [Stephania yunnanensis]|uniref:Uncharacterized protein n=1 Tax=Stephania yunnanensis TaxID=152371 RepID=A0AAP0ISY5_9MAGN
MSSASSSQTASHTQLPLDFPLDACNTLSHLFAQVERTKQPPLMPLRVNQRFMHSVLATFFYQLGIATWCVPVKRAYHMLPGGWFHQFEVNMFIRRARGRAQFGSDLTVPCLVLAYSSRLRELNHYAETLFMFTLHFFMETFHMFSNGATVKSKASFNGAHVTVQQKSPSK